MYVIYTLCIGTTMITAVDFSRALGAKFIGQTNIGISPEVDLVFGGLTLGMQPFYYFLIYFNS